jgi:multidrug efflux system membrane fusion protein
VDGIVARINFREGEDVPAGAPLVTLDERPFANALLIARADLAAARAAAAQAAADAERYTRLDQQAAVSKEQLDTLVAKADSARAAVLAREAAVANAELQLGYTAIKAPIAGRTGELGLHEGALVKANDASTRLVTINQLSPIAVAFSLPENTLPDLRAALARGPVSVQVRRRDSAAVATGGTVDFVDNTVDPTTGMILVKARFTNGDLALWPGQFVTVELQLGDEPNQVVVPTPAVQIGQNGSQVFIVNPNSKVTLRPVTVGRTTGDLAIISAGLKGDETVVTDGQFRLVPGARVEVRPLAVPAPAAATP